MAKKKFNVTSTLNKNKTTESALAPKIPLRKNDKDLEEVKEKVESLHSTEVKVEQPMATSEKVPTTEQPAPLSHEQIAGNTPHKPEEPEKLVRLTIDTPAEMHTRLKVKAVLSGISMRDYILRLLEKELKKE